jgi:hypothetical protein
MNNAQRQSQLRMNQSNFDEQLGCERVQTRTNERKANELIYSNAIDFNTCLS